MGRTFADWVEDEGWWIVPLGMGLLAASLLMSFGCLTSPGSRTVTVEFGGNPLITVSDSVETPGENFTQTFDPEALSMWFEHFEQWREQRLKAKTLEAVERPTDYGPAEEP